MGYLGIAKVSAPDGFKKLSDFTDVELIDDETYLIQPNQNVFAISSVLPPPHGFLVSANEMTQFIKRAGEDIYIRTTSKDEVIVIISN